MGIKWQERAVVPWWWGHYDSCTSPVPVFDMWQDFSSGFMGFPGGPKHIKSLLWPQSHLKSDTLDEVEGDEDIGEDKDEEDEDIAEDTDEWIPALKLTIKDKREILNGEMLSDKHINAAQTLLQAQFPWVEGFQDSCLCQTEFQPVDQGGLQIHHTRGNHWVLSSSLSQGFVRLYDSMYTDIDEDLECQLTEIYLDKADFKAGSLYVNIMPCEKQYGETDCALFAIAWAFELCQGRDFSNKKLIQCEIRRHFIECLEQGEILSFPMEPAQVFRRKPLPNIAVINIP